MHDAEHLIRFAKYTIFAVTALLTFMPATKNPQGCSSGPSKDMTPACQAASCSAQQCHNKPDSGLELRASCGSINQDATSYWQPVGLSWRKSATETHAPDEQATALTNTVVKPHEKPELLHDDAITEQGRAKQT
jgi:hypothetical protein